MTTARARAASGTSRPAIHIHTELHRRRPDARVVIHNHPYHVVVLAAIGVLPEIVHQPGSMFDDDLASSRSTPARSTTPTSAPSWPSRSADAHNVILASHGVIVTGATIAEATYRAASIDRMCRLAYDVHGLRPRRRSRSARDSGRA